MINKFSYNIFLYAFVLLISIPSFAQFKEGYNKEEVRDMIALCNSFTFLDLYKSDIDILPLTYKKQYTSPVFGMDNKFQIYKNGNVGIINLRGSTAERISWMENIYSSMIPAQGEMEVLEKKFKYKFATDTGATVHTGYALGIAYLATDIIKQINLLHKDGVSHIIITGHSQGGALANMLRAYLENLSSSEISKKIKFKTYAFAAPMVGNKYFTEEYKIRYADFNTSYNIINPADPIPNFPISYNDTTFVSQNFKRFTEEGENFSFKRMAAEGMFLLLKDNIVKSTQRVGYSLSEQISKDLGPVKVPDPVNEINYSRLSNLMEINTASYPKILKDPSILKNDSLMATYPKDSEGNFKNTRLYKKEPWAFQHKPYNYYTMILKMYFPNEYNSLKRKYLPENL